MLSFRAIVLLLLPVAFAIIFFYFYFNPSYQKSFEAKFYYTISKYKDAYELSKEAYELDKYNRMAFTIKTQSEISLKYVKYIDEANEYLKKIELISDKKEFKKDDRIRIKLMCEVMIEKYKKLVPTKLTDNDLLDRSLKLKQKFESIYKELFDNDLE